LSDVKGNSRNNSLFSSKFVFLLVDNSLRAPKQNLAAPLVAYVHFWVNCLGRT